MSINPLKETHKTLRIPLSDELCADARVEELFDRFNSNFDERSVRITRNGGGYDINLCELSIDKLDSVLTLLEQGASDYSNALDAVRQTIHGVKSYGLRGKKRVFVGYNRERKVTARKAKETRRGKHLYSGSKGTVVENNCLPESFKDSVLCGDSEKVLQALPDNCVDLVFTSPPYNFGLEYDGDNLSDASKWNAYFDKLFAILDECVRVLKHGGRLVINVQPLFSDYIPSHHVISGHLMQSSGLLWKGEVLWEKNNYNCKYTAWGSWKSPSSPYLKYTWEFLEIFCKGTLKKEGRRQDADIAGDDFKKWVYAKWSIAPERNMKLYGHPAMFPEELAR